MNTPHPWKSWREPVVLQNPTGTDVPATYVRFAADKQPGTHFELAMAISYQRAQARGWRLIEVDTVHQILPDPASKATVLLELAAEQRRSRQP